MDCFKFGAIVNSVKTMEGYWVNSQTDGKFTLLTQFQLSSIMQPDEHPSKESILASSHYSYYISVVATTMPSPQITSHCPYIDIVHPN